MHRATGRSSDEFSVSFPPAALKGFESSHNSLTGNNYNLDNGLISNDDVSKKVMSLKASPGAEKAIHLIPLVLFLCALVLWLFSSHVTKKPAVIS
ncbi:Unknown protein [Striga hermonthica]|uniref:Uncharacterized protein n=1 Tax=Striga hermonthica TaxID=68872 RepID=A0A9N7N1W4_STRHE|nr:Unknown protein [Striga hermonthica]